MKKTNIYGTAGNIFHWYASLWMWMDFMNTIIQNGHAAGDKMLRYIAQMLKKYLSNTNTFRMGGDEFPDNHPGLYL